MAFITKAMPSKWLSRTLQDLLMNIMNSCGICNIQLTETPPVESPPEAFFCFALSPAAFSLGIHCKEKAGKKKQPSSYR